MKRKAIQFPYVAIDPALGDRGLRPLLPISLVRSQRTISVMGLLDSGASINVLPFDLGIQLGADWDQQTISLQLEGNLAESEAKALLVTATVANFPPVKLAFAWSKLNSIPVILGQVNFFTKFDGGFFRSRLVFEVGQN